MFLLIVILSIAGVISGLIQFFVDFKKLPVDDHNFQLMDFKVVQPTLGWFNKLLEFFKKYWTLFAYITLGVAGAFLVPVINELTNNGLRGLDKVKAYYDCVASPNKLTCLPLSSWYKMILFGYAIIFGYSAVRIIRNIGALLLGNVTGSRGPKQPGNTNVNPGGEIKFLDLNHNAFSGTILSCLENPKPWQGKPWRPAKAIARLLSQINDIAPDRSKVSDGIIGDTAHQQRVSDHNPWILDPDQNIGVVTAIDITQDPSHHCDCNILADTLEKNQDARIKYVIWNKRIMNSSTIEDTAPWTWRPYSGLDPHESHIHISVKCQQSFYDQDNLWKLE